MYLSGRTRQFFINPSLYGCMFNSAKTTGREWDALEVGCKWAFDNGAFSDKFDFNQWIIKLVNRLPYRENCICVVIPDVPYNHEATRKKFYRYADFARALGYPVAFASQNGATPNNVPWDDFDVLFIGGDDNHKRGHEARELINEAKRRGMWVHVGRASTGDAIGQYWPDCDSWDGTTFTREKAGGEGEGNKMQRMSKVLENIKKGNYYTRRFLL